MGALSLLPHLVSLQFNTVSASPVRPYLVFASSPPPPRLRVLSRWKSPVTVRASREAERPGARGESLFFDENGVVDDMDGYLNYLSLEYDSVWDTKPAWVKGLGSRRSASSSFLSPFLPSFLKYWSTARAIGPSKP